MIILHIEDDENDVCLVAAATSKADADARTVAVPSVIEAQAYLEGKGVYTDRTHYPLPDLILLDLGMPGRDGFDFLQWRNRTHWADVPVVALTSSLDERLLKRAEAMGAALSFTKPNKFADLVWLMAGLCSTAPATSLSHFHE